MAARIALITGGGTGIGRGIALALARRGVDLALVGRREALLEAVAHEARALGVRAVAIPGDLAQPSQCAAVVAAARAALGSISILVNNAGSLSSGPFDQLSPNAIQQAVALNLTAPLLLTHEVLPDLLAQTGAVVVVGSMVSRLPLPYTSLYTATKTGLHGFTAALRYELEAQGVRLLMAYPPTTATAMTEAMAGAAGFAANSPFARMAAPETIGEQIVAALAAGRRTMTWRSSELFAARLAHIAPWLVRAALNTQLAQFRKIMQPRSDVTK